jgi:hypothetical protein
MVRDVTQIDQIKPSLNEAKNCISVSMYLKLARPTKLISTSIPATQSVKEANIERIIGIVLTKMIKTSRGERRILTDLS